MNLRNRIHLTEAAYLMRDAGIHLIVVMGPTGPIPIAPEAVADFVAKDAPRIQRERRQQQQQPTDVRLLAQRVQGVQRTPEQLRAAIRTSRRREKIEAAAREVAMAKASAGSG